MAAEWVVVIETTGKAGSPMDIRSLRWLMELMADRNPTTLYSPDRYALQVVVQAETPEQALGRAVAAWREAQDQLRIEGWELVRAEVITAAEFEREAAGRTQGSGDEGQDLGEVLLRRAFHDEVTGLASRELFVDHLRHELSRAERTGGQLALLVFEIGLIPAPDGWSQRDVVEVLAVAVADRLTSALRGRDSLARVGEDRFSVLLHDVSEAAALDVAARLLRVLAQPVMVGTGEVVVPLRSGVVTSDGADTADSLLFTAELSLETPDESTFLVPPGAEPPLLDARQNDEGDSALTPSARARVPYPAAETAAMAGNERSHLGEETDGRLTPS
jgi:diguanylate cyclase (GGDEF)-like protein